MKEGRKDRYSIFNNNITCFKNSCKLLKNYCNVLMNHRAISILLFYNNSSLSPRIFSDFFGYRGIDDIEINVKFHAIFQLTKSCKICFE